MKHLFWLLLLLMQTFVPAKGDTGTDSLHAVLSNLPPEERLAKLNELANRNFNQDQGMYARWLYKEAVVLQDEEYRATALYQLARYYYAKNPDSMRYYITEAEPLFLSQKRYEDLFRMKAWNLYSLSAEGNQEVVLPIARELIDLARELNYPEGEEMANQALANFYMRHELKQEAMALYVEVLSAMERRNAPIVKRFNILRQLVNASLPEEDHDRFLEQMKACLQECEAKGMTELGAEVSLDYGWYVYYRTLASDANQARDKESARKNLEKAEALVNKNNWTREKSTIDNIKVYYYELVGQYNEAIALTDSLIEHFKSVNKQTVALQMLKLKGEMCYKAGLGMDAAEMYQQYIDLNDSITSRKYYSDLANWRTQHDVDKLELENKQMELETSKIHTQLLLMGGGLILLVLVCLLLGFISYSRHKYGQQLKLAKEKAEEADRLKSTFLANMNHEIRTPLNAIVGFSQILVDEDDRSVREEYLNIIQNNNNLLQRLISDVLDLSKIESNSMSFTYQDVDLAGLMRDIHKATLLRVPEGVSLELKTCESLTFFTDSNRLTQIITNLLNNAIKHTEKGVIRFGYEVMDAEVQFFVEDTGKGIPADKLETIFSRFVQLNDWNKGVGLGLAICKGLITKMGGTIEVASELGKGSVFRVVLPIKD